LVVAGLCLSACKSGAICDADELDAALLETVDPGQRRPLAAAAVLQACQVPEGLKAGLAHVKVAIGEDACAGALQGIDAAPAELSAACVGGEKAVRALATAPDGKAFLVDACELERLGVATRDELLRGAPWPCQLLGAMTYVALRNGGEPAAKAIARALMLRTSVAS